MAKKRVYGWKKQDYDHRDWVFTPHAHMVAQLPPSLDLGGDLGIVLNQDQEGCCGPHSAAENIMYDDKKQGFPVVTPSRNFIYWVTRFLMGTTDEDSGVDNRTMLKALARFGYCDETLWPYDESAYTTKPSKQAFADAKKRIIRNYAAVQKNLQVMKAALVAKHPIIFGFNCYPSLESDATALTGDVPDPKPGETSIGGHDILLYGYNDARQRFLFRNHWFNEDGTPWGNKGNGTISYQYATGGDASDFWTINSILMSILGPKKVA